VRTSSSQNGVFASQAAVRPQGRHDEQRSPNRRQNAHVKGGTTGQVKVNGPKRRQTRPQGDGALRSIDGKHVGRRRSRSNVGRRGQNKRPPWREPRSSRGVGHHGRRRSRGGRRERLRSSGLAGGGRQVRHEPFGGSIGGAGSPSSNTEGVDRRAVRVSPPVGTEP